MMVVTFVTMLAAFLVVGIYSAKHSQDTTSDYYLASNNVHPMLAGLSAVATNNSGYMFIGVIGYTYAVGLASIWLMVGWIVGDFIASMLVYRQLRVATGDTRELSFAGVVSRWTGVHQPLVQVSAALLSIVFLGAYSAAQLSAGGKALHVLLGWNLHAGAFIVAVIVAVYCIAGGIRASIWTDVAQSFVMLIAMGLLLFAAVQGLGGMDASLQRLDAIPGHMDWFPRHLLFPGMGGMALFVIGWLFAGLSVAGQPHIMIRFMALDKPAHLARARWWYYGFFTVFYALATGVGLLSRVYLPELTHIDPELALPTMAQHLLPPVLVGLVLAGIFAATMSTADSLVLSCSACMTNDLWPRLRGSKSAAKTATLATTALALIIAVTGSSSVFQLVILAWSTLAAAFVPLVLVLAIGGRPSQGLTLAMMFGGPAISLLWRHLGYHTFVYEGLPGIVTGLLIYFVGRYLQPRRQEHPVAAEPGI